MSNSITASNSSAPFNGYLLSDANFTVSQSWQTAGGSTSWNFKVASPWPSINQTEVYVYTTAQTGTSTSASAVYAQESADNSTWTNCANLAAPLLSVTGAASSAYITLQPGAKQYFRVSGSTAGAPTGSFGATLLF